VAKKKEVIEEVTVHVEEIRKEGKETETGNRDTKAIIRLGIRECSTTGKPGTIDARKE
jgi:DNA mismatch repair protein MutS2